MWENVNYTESKKMNSFTDNYFAFDYIGTWSDSEYPCVNKIIIQVKKDSKNHAYLINENQRDDFLGWAFDNFASDDAAAPESWERHHIIDALNADQIQVKEYYLGHLIPAEFERESIIGSNQHQPTT